MADTPYPVARDFRRTDVLVGNGGTVYSGFGFKIFDVNDVAVYLRRAIDLDFILTEVVVTKDAALDYDDFSVTFATALTAADQYFVIGATGVERTAGVRKGTKLDPDALEREFSRIAMMLNELRRDLNRAVLADPADESAPFLSGTIADDQVLIRSGNKIIGGVLLNVANPVDGSAVVTALATKAGIAYVDAQLALKASTAALSSGLALKQDAATAVTLTGAQTLMDKTLETAILNAPQLNAPALILPNDATQTAAGKLTYDSATGRLVLGKGSGASAKLVEGAWEKLGLLVLAGASNQVISGLSPFWALRLSVNADGSGASNLQGQLSADGGATFHAGANHDFWYDGETANTPGAGYNGTDTSLTLGVGGKGASVAELFGLNKAGAIKRVIGRKMNQAGTPNIYSFGCQQAAFTYACDTIKLFASSGTITATILIEGVRG